MFLNLQFKYIHACEVMHGSLHCYNIVVHVSACVQCVCRCDDIYRLQYPPKLYVTLAHFVLLCYVYKHACLICLPYLFYTEAL